MSDDDLTLGAAWRALRRRASAFGRLLSGEVDLRVQEHARDLADLTAGMATVDRNHAQFAESAARHLAGLQAGLQARSEAMERDLVRLQAEQQQFERSAREQFAVLQSVVSEVAALHASLRALETTVADVERGQTAIATALARSTLSDPRREG